MPPDRSSGRRSRGERREFEANQLRFCRPSTTILPLGDSRMAGLCILAALVLGAAAFVFYNAHDQLYFGTQWAVDVCSTSKLFCGHSEYLAYAGGVSLVLAIGFGLGKAMRAD
jgi:hypothetical protein